MTEAGGHVVIPDIDLETYPAFTISLYAKEDGVTSTDGEAYIFYGDATNGMISIANYGGLGFFVGSAVVGMPFPPSYLHQWKKYTLVWEAPILMAYVNDSLINTASGIAACWGGVKGGVARHWWYSNTVSSTRLIGNIDDIRIYKRALCDYEVMVGMNTRVLSATVSSASICTGDSSTIMLHNPQPGIQYQMINQGNGAPVGLPMGPVCDSIILFQTGPLGSTQQYTILAKDTNYNCQKTLDTILTVTVNPIPVANILPGNTSLCLGDSVLLTAYSSIVGASYNWADSQTTQSIWVKSAGISDYIVTVTNNGCSDTAMASVTINTIPGITIVPVNPVACQGDTVQLTANPAPPGGSFVWNTGTTTASVNVIPLVSGTQYSVKYTLNGCSNNDSVSIQLNPLPVVSISPATAEICEGDTLTLTASSNLSGANWTWNSGQNTASILIQPLVSTVYNVTATVNDCDGQANLTVVLHPMPTITMNPAVDTICEGDTILLTASSNQEGLTYTWNTGMMDSLISIHPTTNSTYWVTVTNDWCENKNSAFIQVDLIPEITVSPSDTTICKGDAIILNVNTSAPSPGFHWNFGATQASLSVSTNYTTLYQVTVTSGLCAASGGVLVDVVPVPDVNLGADDYICEGSTVVLNCQLGYSAYLWSDGSQGSALEVSQPGLVWVRVYDKGCSNSDTITLLQCTEIFVPNVFTPNGDGKNDNFYPKGVSVNDFEMFIFNRWGEFLFSTTDMLAGWDGRYKGELCIDGVYYYLINYTGTGIKRQINGIVTLMK